MTSLDNHAGVRDLVDQDYDQWADLYHQYRDFYMQSRDEEVVRRTWSWLIGKQYGLQALVAEDRNGTLIGLAHLRLFARPSSGAMGLYVDDLFTSPDNRGAGVGTALLREAGDRAVLLGAPTVRWITAEDNATARSLYEKLGTATRWVTYDMAASEKD